MQLAEIRGLNLYKSVCLVACCISQWANSSDHLEDALHLKTPSSSGSTGGAWDQVCMVPANMLSILCVSSHVSQIQAPAVLQGAERSQNWVMSLDQHFKFPWHLRQGQYLEVFVGVSSCVCLRILAVVHPLGGGGALHLHNNTAHSFLSQCLEMCHSSQLGCTALCTKPRRQAHP